VILVDRAQDSARRRFYPAPMTPKPPIRVLIADDHRLFAETLGLALDAHPLLRSSGMREKAGRRSSSRWPSIQTSS
jgi:hypothetical protein